MVSVANVETISPPMTARASGAVCAAAFAEADRHRQHAGDHGRGGHEDGAQAAAGALARRIEERHARVPRMLGEGHQQNRIGDRDSDRHDRAHEGLHVERGGGQRAASAARRTARRES